MAETHALYTSGEWHHGCPVLRRNLRVLTARYYGFDHRTHLGQIVVNEAVAAPLAKVFRKLYAMRFPIREMSFGSMYGPHPDKDGDVTASFECRNAVPSPCNGNTKGTHWSCTRTARRSTSTRARIRTSAAG